MDRLRRLASNWAGTISSRQRTSMRPPPLRREFPAPESAASKCGRSGHRWLEPRRLRPVLNMTARVAERIVEEVFRRESGRVLATLIRLLGDFDLAEEARQEAFVAAMEQWAADGVPGNPSAWLIKTGRNKAVDRIRRDIVFRTKVFDR